MPATAESYAYRHTLSLLDALPICTRWSSATSPTKATAWPARSRRCGVRRTERKEGAWDSWFQFFLIVVGLPVVLGIGSDMYRRHLKFKERQLTAISHETAEKAAQYAAQTERLEERVRVLERIVTDKGIDVEIGRAHV